MSTDQSDKRPVLRVGIMINGTDMPMWQYRLLEKIQAGDFGKLVLAIIRTEPETPTTSAASASPQGNSIQKLKKSIAQKIFYRYQAFDRKKFKSTPDPFANARLDDLFATPETAGAAMDVLHVTPITTTWSDRVNEQDLEKIRAYDLDVVLRFGWRIVRGEILSVPRHGVWSYHHGDNRVNRGGPPCIWELYHDHDCTGVTLQLLSEDLDNGKVIARSFTATDKISANRTRKELYWRSVDLLPRKLAELQQVGGEIFFSQLDSDDSINASPEFYSQPLLSEKAMTLEQTLNYVRKCLTAYVKKALFTRGHEEKWVLYYDLSDSMATSLWKYKLLESPNDRYWADPHILLRDGIWYVFVEEYMYNTKRGRIAVLTINKDGEVGEAQTALDTDYHLSYPYVFEHQGRTFMIPESGASRRIELWECTDFPAKWELRKILMDNIHAVDTTLHFKDGRWWMFTNTYDTEGGNTYDELFLYSSDELMTDQWTRHPQSAIVSDVRGARPAGTLFEEAGKLYRPGQDCAKDYGYALRLHEVVTLNENEYEEREVTSITPDWNKRVRGVHTLARAPGITMVDAKTFIKRKDVDKG